MKKIWFYDIETWYNFHCVTFINKEAEEKKFIIYNGNNQINNIKEYIQFLQEDVSGLIGYNVIGYDYKLIHYILQNKQQLLNESCEKITQQLYEESIKAIENKEEIYYDNILIPQLDLFLIHHFNNKNKYTSLKYIEINTKFENVEDLPFEETKIIEDKDISTIMEYNRNDVLATIHFYNLSIDEIELRKVLKKQFNFDGRFLNYNDTKIGSEIFAKELSKELQIPIKDLKQLRTYRQFINLNEVILPKIQFKTKEFNILLSKLKSTVIKDTQKPFEYNVIYKGFKYNYGVGGIHGCIEPGIYKADEHYDIIDIDVDGMYPATAINNEFYPKHLGKDFCKVYKNLYDMRIQAKREYNLDKTNNTALAISSGLKLANNGVFGSFNTKLFGSLK